MSEPVASSAWMSALPEMAAEVRFGDFTGAVEVLLTDTPEGKSKMAITVDDGAITDVTTGKSDSPALTVEMTAATFAAMVQGVLDAEVAYMRGDIKLGENYELALFDWRPTYRSDEWAGFIESLAMATDFTTVA